MTERYTVQPLLAWGTEYYVVWDTLLDRKHESSAAWLTERFAQGDADELNADERRLRYDK